MAIAPATLDFDSFGKLMRPAVPADTPILEALKACPQLERAPAEALRLLARDATLRAIGRARTRPQGGGSTSPGRCARKVRAVCRAVNGREISMEMFRAGDLIAEGRWRRETPLAHDWEAVEASTLLLIPRETFLACLRAAPELALSLGADLVARLERSKQLATGLALAGVQERVVSRLVASGARMEPRAGWPPHSQPSDTAGAGQPDRRLSRNGLSHRLGAGPSGAPHAARTLPPRQQAPRRNAA